MPASKTAYSSARHHHITSCRLARELKINRQEIAENVTGFFAILAEWSRAELPAPANDAGKPIASDNKEADHDR